jgi:hypothetical protein
MLGLLSNWLQNCAKAGLVPLLVALAAFSACGSDSSDGNEFYDAEGNPKTATPTKQPSSTSTPSRDFRRH